MKALLLFLFRYRPKLLILAMVLGAIAGLATTSLIAMIHQATEAYGQATVGMMIRYGLLCLAYPITRVFSQVLTTYIVQSAVYDMRLRVSERILQSPLRRLEEVGAPRLLVALTSDIGTICNAMNLVPMLNINMVMIMGCLGYMFYLHWPAAMIILCAIFFGIAVYALISRHGYRTVVESRLINDDIYEHFVALTNGMKELKVNRIWRKNFKDHSLEPAVRGLRKTAVHGTLYFGGAASSGQTLFFVAIGLMLFLSPMLSTTFDGSLMSAFTYLLLYMVVPLEGIVLGMPQLFKAVTSYKQVEKLGLSLSENIPQRDDVFPKTFHTLEFKGISHKYFVEEADDLFTLGPMDLSFKPGELVFIIGGNGSGKTTLAKLLLGLYHSDSGEIVLDGELITREARDNYRQLFSTVFSDFFLFKQSGTSDVLLNDEAQQKLTEMYLKKLHLEHKVKLQGGTLSTQDLSQGQRKRLALLRAYLEDRPFYLFDEWASDQDPVFKEIFYRTLLPELKKRGKTVLAITHDDHYFDVADRIIKLDYGQIEYDRSQ